MGQVLHWPAMRVLQPEAVPCDFGCVGTLTGHGGGTDTERPAVSTRRQMNRKGAADGGFGGDGQRAEVGRGSPAAPGKDDRGDDRQR